VEETKSTLTDAAEGPTFNEVYDSLTEKQKNVIHFVVGEQKTDISQGDKMTHNIYEGEENTKTQVLAHGDIAAMLTTIIADSTATSLKKAFLAHTLTYGVEGVEILMPEAQNVRGDGEPYLNKKDKLWVEKVLGAVDHVGFSKIKSTYADIDEEIARARGYITGNVKFSAVYRVFGRETTAQTVYTRQQMDRDQVLEITSFNMLSWLKKMMYIKQREEVAQAILIGDFRADDHADKIFPDKIRNVYTDHDIYSHKVAVPLGYDILQVIDGIVAEQTNYKGAGSPTLYCSQEVFTAMMLVRDNDGHRIHKTRDELLAALLITELVIVTPMSGVIRVDEDANDDEFQLLGILVNLQDYTVGTVRGGENTWFEGFDMDVNRHKALVETRISGALVTPKAAIVFEQALQ
jgi:hypothetical protein